MCENISFNDALESDRKDTVNYLFDKGLCLADIARYMRTNLSSIKYFVDIIIARSVISPDDIDLREKDFNERIPKLSLVYYLQRFGDFKIYQYSVYKYMKSLHELKLKEFREKHMLLSDNFELLQITTVRMMDSVISKDSVFPIDELIFELWICSFREIEIWEYLSHFGAKKTYVHNKIKELQLLYKNFFYRAFTIEEIMMLYSEIPNVSVISRVSGIPVHIFNYAISQTDSVRVTKHHKNSLNTSGLNMDKYNTPYIQKCIEMGKKLDAIRDEGILLNGKKIYPNVIELEEYSRNHKELRLPRCRTTISKDLRLYYATIEDDAVRMAKMKSIARHKPGMQTFAEKNDNGSV